MSFDRFFTTISQTAANSSFAGIFGTTAATISLSANLNALSSEGAAIISWVRYRIGEPRVVANLDNLQIFSAFEEANIEYSAAVNQFQAKNYLSSILGLNRDFTTSDYSGRYPHNVLDNLMRLANPFAFEAGAGGVQNNRRAYVTVTTTGMDYNLLNDFTDNASGSSLSAYITSISASRIDVRKMWHGPPAAMYKYYDPFSSPNVLSRDFNYESYKRYKE